MPQMQFSASLGGSRGMRFEILPIKKFLFIPQANEDFRQVSIVLCSKSLLSSAPMSKGGENGGKQKNILGGLIYSMFNNCNWDLAGSFSLFSFQLSIIEVEADKKGKLFALLIKIHSVHWRSSDTEKAKSLLFIVRPLSAKLRRAAFALQHKSNESPSNLETIIFRGEEEKKLISLSELKWKWIQKYDKMSCFMLEFPTYGLRWLFTSFMLEMCEVKSLLVWIIELPFGRGGMVSSL